MEIMHKPPPQNAVQWADRHYYLSAESSGTEQRWTTLPYQRAPLLCMGCDGIRIVNWIKSARVGYTKLLCVINAYFIAHRRRNGLIYQPTDSDAADFVADEINTSLRDVAVLGDLLLSDPGKLSRYNKTDKKVFHGATLDIKGGKSARNFRRMTKDYVIFDELDGFDPDIEGAEGTPVSLGDVRITTSSFPKSIRGSTPRLEGASLIQIEVLKADMLFERYLPCPHCDDMQVLRFVNLKFDNKDPETARFECDACSGAITYDHYAKMDIRGQWRTEHGVCLDDETGRMSNEDGPVAYPRSVAFHIWAAYSYFMGWPSIVMEFLAANAEKKRGNRGPMKTFTNTILGETYGEDKTEADTDKLKRHREPYKAEVPAGVQHITAAVDVQDDRLEIEICGWGEHEESWSLHYRALYGKMDRIEIWDILEELLNTPLTDEDDGVHDIKLATIDSGGHYTSEVYKFCARNHNKYIPIKGHAESGKPIAAFPTKLNNHGVRLTMVGTDTAKEMVYDRYKIADVGPGYCHYPVAGEGVWQNDEYGDSYFDMATAEHFVLRYNKKGHKIKVWEKQNSRRNEALDCRVYNLAAIRILQQHYGIKFETLGEKPPEPVEKVVPPTLNKERQKRNKPRKQSGFTNSWRR